MKSAKRKLSSRKFWFCVAVFIGGVGAFLSGINLDNQIVTIVGAGASILAGCIYTICETIIDEKEEEEE